MKPIVKSAGAVVAGFAVTAIASTAMDAIMHSLHVFPASARDMSESLFALASGYRAAFTVVGGYVTARLAPDRPVRHSAILAGIGLLAGIAGVIGYYVVGNGDLGPAWYAFSIPIEAIPCVMLGGWLASRRAVQRGSG